MTLAKVFYEKTNIDFTDFYNKYKNYYIHIIYKYIRNRETAEDLLNDAFVNILTYINTYDTEKSLFTTWTYTIVLNTIKMYHKKNRLNIIYSDEIVYASDIEELLINDEDEIDETYAKIFDIITNNMEHKPDLKNAVILRDIMRMSYKEIADLLKININTIKSRVKIGRKMVNDLYKKKYKN